MSRRRVQERALLSVTMKGGDICITPSSCHWLLQGTQWAQLGHLALPNEVRKKAPEVLGRGKDSSSFCRTPWVVEPTHAETSLICAGLRLLWSRVSLSEGGWFSVALHRGDITPACCLKELFPLLQRSARWLPSTFSINLNESCTPQVIVHAATWGQSLLRFLKQ